MDNERKKFLIASLIILLCSFLIFFTPQLIRFFTSECPLIGSTTYYHARIGDIFRSGKLYDDLSFQGRDLSYPPLFHLIIAFFSFFFGSGSNACFFLGPLLGAFTVLYISLILKEMNVNRFLSLIFCLIPIGIYSFGHCNSRALTFLFGVMSLYYTIKSNNFSILFAALGVFSHPEGFLFIGVNFFYVFLRKRSVKPMIYATIISVLLLVPHFMIFGFPQDNMLYQEYMNSPGSSLHFSGLSEIFMFNQPSAYLDLVTPIIFLLFLFYKKDFFLSALFFGFLILTIAAERFAIYLALPLAIGVAVFLNRNRWKYAIIALIIPFTIISGLWISSLGPSDCFCRGMHYIKDTSPADSTVLADWTHGQWVEELAQRKTVIDAYVEYAPNIDERLLAMKAIYKSNDSELIRNAIIGYNIDYIVYSLQSQTPRQIGELQYQCDYVRVYRIPEKINVSLPTNASLS